MDLALKYKITVLLFSLNVVYSAAISGNEDINQDTRLDDVFFKYKAPVKSISKRGADWSSRQSQSKVSSVEYKLDAQESDKIDVTTKLPRIVRKIRFQNVPQQARHFEKHGNNVEKYGNDTITSDKQGRVVRVRKFRKKITTESPKITTTTSTAKSVTLRPKVGQTVQHFRNENSVSSSTVNPMLFRSVTPQMMQYAHITVINKEVIDQKPNRKLRNKKPSGLSVSLDTFGEGDFYKNERDLKTQSLESAYKSFPNKIREHHSPEINKNIYSGSVHLDDLIGKSSNHEDVSPKMNTRRQDVKITAKTPPPQENIKKSISQISKPKVRNSVRDVKRIKTQQTRNVSQISETTSTTLVPKSAEILSDSPLNQDNSTIESISQPILGDKYNNEHEVTTQPPLYTDKIPGFMPPGDGLHLSHMTPNIGFRQLPQQEFQGYPYGSMNPFFRSPGVLQPPQNVNPLSPLSFRPPQFHHQNENPQFQGFYSPGQHQFSPYQRSGSSGTPGFYHSPHLESLRRSIMDVYDEEESIESTTEYSLPKFEIPSIDFNDKGCRTVYKEVSAVPVESANRRSVENQAKSFVMTRECFFPEGVPTTKTADGEKYISETTGKINLKEQ